MSALFTNDTMCIALTKTICYVCTQRGFHPGPQMVAIAMSANLGSAATLIGNPQNAIIAALSGVPFATFLAYSVVAMLVCIVVQTFALCVWFKSDLAENTAFAAAAKEKMAEAGIYGGAGGGLETSPLLDGSMSDGVDTQGNKICCFGPFERTRAQKMFRVILLTIIMITLGCFLADLLSIGWIAAGGGCAAMLMDAVINKKVPDRIFARINWELLIFFCGLFVVIEGLQETELPGMALESFGEYIRVDSISGLVTFVAIVTIGCNVFNNVPFTLLIGLADTMVNGVEVPFMDTIGDPDLAWILLAWVATVAGNLTLMGSVANLIVAEEGKHYFEMTFSYYSRLGFWITTITLYLGAFIIYAMWNIMH
jgi:Na+/H+ antiporter NhaD/arsenite permease-like protein